MVECRPVLSVVIPLFREGAHLELTVSHIIEVVQDLNIPYEIILVDDGSPDDTWKTIMHLTKNYKVIQGIRLSRNFGKESALAAGLDLAVGEAVLVLDGDLQHPPTLIPLMYRHWVSGAEIVEAVKCSRGPETSYSSIGSNIFYTIFKRLTGVNLNGASDFKLMDRKVLEAWKQLPERVLFFRGMSAWLGFNRVQIPFDVPDRVNGESGWSTFQLVRLALNAVTSFSAAPLFLMVISGVGFGILAFILGLQTLYIKLSGHAVDGFSTVIILILVLGSLVMLGLGLIGVYIAKIYEEVKARPRYVVSEYTN